MRFAFSVFGTELSCCVHFGPQPEPPQQRSIAADLLASGAIATGVAALVKMFSGDDDDDAPPKGTVERAVYEDACRQLREAREDAFILQQRLKELDLVDVLKNVPQSPALSREREAAKNPKNPNG